MPFMPRKKLIHPDPGQLLPREKISTLGRQSLSNAELLAIFLRTGSHERNVLQLANDIIQQAGSLEALARLEPEEITKLAKGIGSAKAATLAAAFELGCRAIREEAKRQPFRSADDIYDYMITETRWLNQEKLYILLLNAQCTLIKKLEISTGTLNESIAHPRDIIRPAITHNCYAFILVHNHPSGNPSPSRADNEITGSIEEAANLLQLHFYDHVIMGTPTPESPRHYFSYKASGRLA